MALDADVWAPGAAITAGLCGRWDHEPPCPLAPHHVHAERVAGEVHLRILFAAELGIERVRSTAHRPGAVWGAAARRGRANYKLGAARQPP